MQSYLITITGALIYFILEFKSRSLTTPFQLGYWIKDNWMNIILLIACNIAYLEVVGTPTKEAALLLGLAPNLAVDWAQNLFNKYNSKS